MEMDWFVVRRWSLICAAFLNSIVINPSILGIRALPLQLLSFQLSRLKYEKWII